MTTPPLADVPIRSDQELTARWAAMLEPPVFSARSLWLTWIDHDGLMLPVVLPVDDIPPVPDAGMLEGLRQLHIGIAQDRLTRGGRLAMALCRPGLFPGLQLGGCHGFEERGHHPGVERIGGEILADRHAVLLAQVIADVAGPGLVVG